MTTQQQRENYLYFYRKFLKARADKNMNETIRHIDMNVFNGIDLAFRLCLSSADYDEICAFALERTKDLRD